jgi:hypothetical protein
MSFLEETPRGLENDEKDEKGILTCHDSGEL